MWFVLLLRQTFSTTRVSAQTAAGVAISLGLFAGGLLAGEKILYLAVLLSVLFIPVLAKESGPWPKLAVALLLRAALGASGCTRTVGHPTPDHAHSRAIFGSWQNSSRRRAKQAK